MSIQQLFFAGEAAPAVVATGGTIYTNGDYKIHAFTTSGNFRVTAINNSSAPYEYYVVGAGDGGFANNANSSSGCGGSSGADGSQGASYSFASGTINAFTVNTDYYASVAVDGSGSDFKGTGSSASGGGAGGAGGANGYPPSNGTAGAIPSSFSWITGVTTRLGAGGGGGGGGCDDPDGGGTYSVGGGAPNGGSGGDFCSDGGNGSSVNNLYWPGAGCGGGGGAGGCCAGGQNGGLGGPPGAGLVIIRYKFQNV